MADDLTPEDFVALYPQFRTSLETLVPKALAYAARNVSRTTFGETYNDAVGFLAADWLSGHMHGQTGRLEEGAGKPSSFRVQYDALLKSRAVRFILT